MSLRKLSLEVQLRTERSPASSGANGSVSPAGVTVLNYGTNLSYSITPSTGYHVLDVLVDGGSVGAVTTYDFTTVTTNHTLSATFAINTYTITALAGSNGAVSPAGISTVNYGASQSYTVTPGACYHIDSVIVDGVNQGAIASYTFTNVTNNHTIRTVYKINTYAISPSVGANGSISPSQVTSVNCGSNQALTITPTACYHVDSVIVDNVYQGKMTSYTFTNVTANHSISAKFVINRDTITASAGSNGSISPSGTVTMNCGANQSFVIAPNLGYKISNVLVDGNSVGAVTSYAFTSVAANHTILASFIIDHWLTVPAKFSTVQSAVTFARHGDTVAVSAGNYAEIVSISGKDSTTILSVGAVDSTIVQGFSAYGSTKDLRIKGFVVDASGTGEHAISFMTEPGMSYTRVTIEACLIRNSSLNGIMIMSPSSAIRIVNNRICSNQTGIVAQGSGTYIINNTIVKNTGDGVSSASSDYVYLVNNVISYNGTGTSGGYGVWRYPPSGGGGEGPIRLGGSPSACPSCIKLVNNLITGNNGTIITTSPPSSRDIRNYTQVLDAADGGNWTTAGNEGAGIAGASTATFDQVFISSSPINLHLKSGAFPINRGINSWSPPDGTAGAIPSTDFEGTSRPLGGTVDMGADELQ